MRSRRSRRWRGMIVISWDSQRKATSEGVRGPVPERGAGLAIGIMGGEGNLYGWGAVG